MLHLHLSQIKFYNRLFAITLQLILDCGVLVDTGHIHLIKLTIMMYHMYFVCNGSSSGGGNVCHTRDEIPMRGRHVHPIVS